MIATLSSPPLSTPHMGRRTSNSAGGPLPLIPRRASTHRSPQTPTMVASSSVPLSVPITTVTSPSSSPPQAERGTHRDDEGLSDSSSDNYLSIRPKRVRGVRTSGTGSGSGMRKPEHSTPAPSKTEDDFSSPDATPRPRSFIRKSVPRAPTSTSAPAPPDALKYRTVSESDISGMGLTTSHSAPLASPGLILKKSGEPVRSSLKGSRAKLRGNLSVVTDAFAEAAKYTASAPTTPNSHRGVQFRAELEQVKLFFAEQKPLAVSRDGSPTEDTSGTDNDFPSWIYGDGPAPSLKTRLSMKLLNKPSRTNLIADVVLEDMSLASDGTNIVGRIRLRNLAFQKWVAIRFTFDSWQTTSEVSGKYASSIDSQFDRFTFTIRLNDLLPRIESKTLQLAVRYSIEGREMWDNNSGLNYIATFNKTKVKVLSRSLQLDEEAASPVVGDLKSKLEKVASSPRDREPLFSSIPNSSTLKSRYDFGASLKNSALWRSPESDTTSRNDIKMRSTPSSTIPFPSSGITSPVTLPKAVNNLGSPRDLMELWASESPSQDGLPRNHQRGYFDIKSTDPSGIRRTPVGTPRATDDSTPAASPGRHHSFPPLNVPEVKADFHLALPGVPPLRLQRDSSDSSSSSASTPSFVSDDSMESSPTESLPSPLAGAVEGAEYKELIDKFCFFTGFLGPKGPASTKQGGPPRCSSLDSISPASSSVSLSSGASTPVAATSPQRCLSFDGISPSSSLATFGSGSSTPTRPSRALFIASPSPTPQQQQQPTVVT
ncbi:putative phosphatase regulatory subunit-domain-containing protein [Flagelloscypha sp. PMI_526]|nr:putative phosphatase regulatory subunit-domain-containing protein [Flagelloscypha sp. PMI_526]